MAESPLNHANGALSYTVYSEGDEVKGNFRLASAWVKSEVNRIGKALLKFVAGDMPGQKFAESDARTFQPGSKIRLDVGYQGKNEMIFQGKVIKLGLKIDARGESLMMVECRDCAYDATFIRHNQIFEKQKDAEIIAAVMKPYGKVDVEATSCQHLSLVQYACTDWDFILSRADANGLLVSIVGDQIRVKKPKVKEKAVLKVSYGIDLIDFDGGVTSTSQYPEVEAVSWNPSQQEAVVSQGCSPQLNAQGNLSVQQLAGEEAYRLQTDALLPSGALQAWAESKALKSGLARFRGKFSFCGSAAVVPACIVELAGLGERFDGNVFVGAVEHQIQQNLWTTTVEMGISPDGAAEKPDVTLPPASGWLPAIEGLHIAKVKKLNGDPAKLQRILVELPWLKGKKNELWARIALPYAGKSMGYFFLPEVGDEVVIGFFNQDPANPVVLGSLYSDSRVPPYELKAENTVKGWVTREKLKIEFDEEKKSISVCTPGGNTIILDDDGKCIQIKDQNRNEIIMEQSGITLQSAKDICLKAKANIILDATSRIQVKAKTDVALEGMNIKATAKVGFSAKGNASAELSASGQTTVKGAMVMIN